LFLPLPNAVAHNGVAALLLAQMLWLTYRSRARRAAWYG
jgi:heme A synthase